MRLSSLLAVLGSILVFDQLIMPVFFGFAYHSDGTGFTVVPDNEMSLIPIFIGIIMIIWSLYERGKNN